MITGLISINKPHTDNIFSEKKGLEWRKKPLPAGLYYVYETKNKGGCGMVIGEMQIEVSRSVDTSHPLPVWLVNAGCVHPAALKRYANNGIIYANFIKNAKRYDKPKPLSAYGTKHKCNLSKKCTEQGFLCAGYCKLTRPPQSWCRVEELKDGR